LVAQQPKGNLNVEPDLDEHEKLLLEQREASEQSCGGSDSESNGHHPSGLIVQSDKLHEAQQQMAVVMYKKRAKDVKRCEFRKFKEFAKDYMQHHDFEQMQMIKE
jgi:hypothetical protein